MSREPTEDLRVGRSKQGNEDGELAHKPERSCESHKLHVRSCRRPEHHRGDQRADISGRHTRGVSEAAESKSAIGDLDPPL